MSFKEVIKKTEDFKKKVDDGDLVFDVEFGIVKQGDSRHKENLRVANELQKAMGMYEIKKAAFYGYAPQEAMLCVIWINKANSLGIVRPSEGLIRKLRECTENMEQLQEENRKLMEDNQKLATENLLLQGHYNEIKRRYDSIMQEKGLEG